MEHTKLGSTEGDLCFGAWRFGKENGGGETGREEAHAPLDERDREDVVVARIRSTEGAPGFVS